MSSTPTATEWPSRDDVSERFVGVVDEQAHAGRFVSETCRLSRASIREAFVAFQMYRTWEVEGLSEADSFTRHFSKGRATLFRWKKASGFLNEYRSEAIRKALSDSDRCMSQNATYRSAIPDRATWRVLDQMALPFETGLNVDAFQTAGEEAIDLIERVKTMSPPRRQAVKEMCARVIEVFEACESAASDPRSAATRLDVTA